MREAGIVEPGADRRWAGSYAPGVPLDIEVPEESLVDLLDSSVRRFGPLVALDFFGAETSYRALGQQVAKEWTVPSSCAPTLP